MLDFEMDWLWHCRGPAAALCAPPQVLEGSVVSAPVAAGVAPPLL